MKKIIATVFFVSSSCAATAGAMSDQDINIMSASVKAVDTYKKVGIGGLFGAVGDCYDKLKAQKTPPGKAVEFCVTLDVSGIFIDDGVARANGCPRDPRFMDAEASSRVHVMLMKLGISRSPADTQAYLGTRAATIQRYANLAMQ